MIQCASLEFFDGRQTTQRSLATVQKKKFVRKEGRETRIRVKIFSIGLQFIGLPAKKTSHSGKAHRGMALPDCRGSPTDWGEASLGYRELLTDRTASVMSRGEACDTIFLEVKNRVLGIVAGSITRIVEGGGTP